MSIAPVIALRQPEHDQWSRASSAAAGFAGAALAHTDESRRRMSVGLLSVGHAPTQTEPPCSPPLPSLFCRSCIGTFHRGPAWAGMYWSDS